MRLFFLSELLLIVNVLLSSINFNNRPRNSLIQWLTNWGREPHVAHEPRFVALLINEFVRH